MSMKTHKTKVKEVQGFVPKTYKSHQLWLPDLAIQGTVAAEPKCERESNRIIVAKTI